MPQGIKTRSVSLYKTLRTVGMMLFNRSDYQRWSEAANLHKDWDTRSELIATLIPDHSSVLEFGAGTMALKRFLPKHCRYTPSDIVDRGDGTIVCNLNDARLPVFAYHDVVVFGGVLEYVYDIHKLISHLSDSCGSIIVSYAVTNVAGQRTALQRRKHGWVNDHDKDELISIFSACGFSCNRVVRWNDQLIFIFNKR